MKCLLLFLAAGAVVLSSCTNETIYYKEAPRYRRSTPSTPAATIPGQAYSVPDRGAPSNFRAAE